MDLSKQQRRLFTEAEQTNREVHRRTKKRPETLVRAMQEFCPACRSVKVDTGCPRCDLHQSVYEMFCNRCLQVHTNAFSCGLWTVSPQAGLPQVLCAKGCFGIGTCSH